MWHSPFFGVAGFFVGILSIILAFVIPIQFQQVREISYFIPEPALIFNSDLSNASNASLRIVDSEGNKIEDSIFFAEVILFNSGDLPIEPDEVVRKPLTIAVPELKVLSFDIVEESSPEISEFQLTESKDSASELILEWNHFDPGNFIKIHIVFAAQPKDQMEPIIRGTIVGTHLQDGYLPTIRRRLPPIYSFLITLGVLIAASSAGIILERLFYGGRDDNIFVTRIVPGIVAVIAMTLLLTWGRQYPPLESSIPIPISNYSEF